MDSSKNREYSSAILIMFIIAIVSLVIAVNFNSLLASFISGFMFCALIDGHLKSKRELEESK